MVWDPALHTVIDTNAIKALRNTGEITGPAPDYLDYLALCQKISRHCGRKLRTVDKALYEYGRTLPEPT
jgi:hypothetical protein